MPPTISASLIRAIHFRHHFYFSRKISSSQLVRNFSTNPRNLINSASSTRISPDSGWRHMETPGGERIRKEVTGSSFNGRCGEREEDEKRSMLLTLPTVLTIGRVAAVPLLVSDFYMNGWWATTATTSIFVAAAITDWLDGYIARKMRLGTMLGAFLDPVADKLMVAATLVLLCTKPLDVAIFEGVPWILTVPSIAIIGREVFNAP